MLATPDCSVPGAWKSRVETFLSVCPRNSLISPALFCHSAYLCGPDTFLAAQKICSEQGLSLFAHVSETQWEVEEISGRYGARPIEHLANIGILEKGLVAVHAIHLTDNEKQLLAQSGAAAVHCPEANMKLASGAARTQDLLNLGVVVGLGTDGPASNNNLDLFEEMRSASLMGKLISGNPESMSARTVLNMATTGGARALGMEDDIGSLKPGKKADVTIVAMDTPHLTPVYDPISHLVYSAKASDVRDVIVNGEIIVRRGRIMTVDEAELRAQVRAMAADIAKDLSIGNHGAVN